MQVKILRKRLFSRYSTQHQRENMDLHAIDASETVFLF